MSANAILTTAVQQWERRRRWGIILESLPYAMLPGLALGTVLAVYARIRPGPADAFSLTVALGGAALGVLGLLAWVGLRRRSPVESARWFDLNFGLKERVSTALELLEGRIKADDGLLALQVADAEHAASKVKAAALMPFTTDWRLWILNLSLLAALAFFMLLVPPVVGADDARERERAAIANAAAELSEIIEDIAADPSLTDEQRGPLLEALQTQLETLRDPNLRLDEALATLGEVEAALSEGADAVQTEIEQEQMAEAAANAALQQLVPNPDAQTLNQNIEAVEGSLESMTAEQLQQAAEALENAAQALEQTNPEAAEALRDAAEAMRQGDLDAARQALQQAATDAQRAESERGEQQQQRDSLQQSADQAGMAQQQTAESAESDSQQPGQSSEGQTGEGQTADGQQGDGMFGQIGSEGATESEGSSSQLAPSDNASEGDSNRDGQVGLGGDGQGDGAADLAQDASAGSQQRGDNRDQPNNPDGRGERDYQEVFSPRFSVEAAGSDELRLGADPGDAPLTEGEFQDNPLGVSVVPYNQVYSSYADAASRALESDYIPLGMRDVVREYFSSLDPQQ